MNNEELQSKIAELNISADKIIREEAEMIFLEYLANDKISTKLVFYGGTALRLAYNSPRYSEDIDLLETGKIKFSDFEKFIAGVVQKTDGWQLKDIKNKRNTIFALLLIADEKLKHRFSIRIEIHKPGSRPELRTELMMIKSPVSILSPLLLVPTIEELKNLKERAVKNRIKPRDIFDLWFISQALREKFAIPKKFSKFNKTEFKNELKVFLPKKYYPVIEQLYDKINPKNK